MAKVPDAALRRTACCDAEPMCVLCPLRTENAHRPLRELAQAGLAIPPEVLRRASRRSVPGNP